MSKIALGLASSKDPVLEAREPEIRGDASGAGLAAGFQLCRDGAAMNCRSFTMTVSNKAWLKYFVNREFDEPTALPF